MAGPSGHGGFSTRARPRHSATLAPDNVHRPHYDHLNLDLDALPRPSVSSTDPASAPIRANGHLAGGARQLYRGRDGLWQRRRLSTASDGADVQDLGTGDIEWLVLSPHGRARGHQEDLLVHGPQREVERRRRASYHAGDGGARYDERLGERVGDVLQDWETKRWVFLI